MFIATLSTILVNKIFTYYYTFHLILHVNWTGLILTGCEFSIFCLSWLFEQNWWARRLMRDVFWIYRFSASSANAIYISFEIRIKKKMVSFKVEFSQRWSRKCHFIFCIQLYKCSFYCWRLKYELSS